MRQQQEPQPIQHEPQTVQLVATVATSHNLLNIQHEPPEQLLQQHEEPMIEQILEEYEVQQFRYFDAAGNEIPAPCQQVVYEETIAQTVPMNFSDCDDAASMLITPAVINTGTGFLWPNK